MLVAKGTNTGGSGHPVVVRASVHAADGRAPKKQTIPGARRIADDHLPHFSRKFSAMLAAGMPIVHALRSLENQTNHEGFRLVIAEVRRAIENGASLSAAMKQFPAVFDKLYVSMVQCGESSGQLPETIGRLADLLAASAGLRKRIKSAMTYPAVVAFIAIVIAAGLVIFVIPIFEDLFTSIGRQLPAPTRFLLDVSNGCRRYGAWIALAAVALVFALKRWRATEAGAGQFDRLVLRVPVFGDLGRKVASARFARTFAQLLRGGVPILGALEVCAGVTGNRAAGDVVLAGRGAVEQGRPLSDALRSQAVFPAMLVEMLQAGEMTGRIDEMMDCIADFYDEEVEATLNGLTAMLEPILMVFIGAIVGGMVVCLFLPIISLPGSIG